MTDTPSPSGPSGAWRPDEDGVPLRTLLLAVGDPLVDVLAAPAGLDVRVDNVVIVDPEDSTEAVDADALDLVLLVGARGDAARRLVRSAAGRGATAVAVKTGGRPGAGESARTRGGADAETESLRAAASEAGVALLAVRPEVRWDQLQSLCRGVLDDARLTADPDLDDTAGDLFSLAQTIAGLTGGLVSIEDPASRVLAYSGGEEVDELRRLSVLGRQGPERYLALLRDWGVFSRLRAGDEVVRIDEHPELGIRHRLAVGIHAGSQPLGAIWVQEGATPLAEQSEEVLLGAARIAALRLLRHRTEASVGLRLRDDLLANLLDGRIEPAALSDTVEVTEHRPALVVAFALADAADGRAAPRDRTGRGAAGGVDRPARELNRRRLLDLISAHAAAYRRSALATALGNGRIYVLLPDLTREHSAPSPGATAHAPVPAGAAGEASALALTRRTVEAARGALGARVRAAMGAPVTTLGDMPRSRAEADRILDVMVDDPGMDVATISQVRSRVLIGETLAHLRVTPELRDPRVTQLAEYDARTGSELVSSVLAYLEEFGDVRAAAHRLHVHPNTLRYRLRRAQSASGLDLGDSDQRLFAHLQLLLPPT